MNQSNYWNRIEKLIDDALILPRNERIDYLRNKCSDNDDLFIDVCKYLTSIELAEEIHFLEIGLQRHPDILNEIAHGHEPDITDHFLNRTIGSYRIEENIGEGGMGAVYRAQRIDGEYEKQVAFKFLRNGLYSPQMRERFRIEKVILSRLDHPNIARLIDGGVTTEGIPYLVMEYVEGLPVDQYCSLKRLSIPERISLFRTICETVQYAHSQLVIHRDLKPKNIYVTNDGIVKVLDFGIAKLLDEDPEDPINLQTRQGQYVLSLQYAAPEQINGGDIATTTDIYVLGILLYQMLTEHFPYDLKNKTLNSARDIMLNQEPVKPGRNANPEIGPVADDLSAIVLKALRKDPEMRYQTVYEFLDDLSRFERKLPVQANKGGYQYRVRKFVDRNRYSLATALTLVFIGVMFLVYHIRTLDEQVKRAEQEAETATMVTDFLVSMFASSDPAVNVEKDITARDLLARGAERISDESLNPETKIKLLLALGDATTKLGDYERAEEFYMNADSLSRHFFDDESYEVAFSIMKMGVYLKERRDYERAEIKLNMALPYFEKNSRQFPLIYASILFNLGSSYQATGRADSSLYFLEKSYEIYLREKPDQSYLYLQNTIAQSYRSLERFNEAEKIYISIIGEIEKHPESDYPTYISVLNNLALLYMSEGNLSKAEEYLNKTLDVTRMVYGDEHPNTIVIFANLLTILARQFKTDEVIGISEKYLNVNRETFGEESWRMATAHRTIGTIYFTLGQFNRANNHLEESYQIFSRALGPEHNWTVNTQLIYSYSLLNENKESEGLQHYNSAVNLLEKNILTFGFYDLEHLKYFIDHAEKNSKIVLGDKLMRVKALVAEKS